MKKYLLAMTALATVSSAANAITYVGTRAVGTATASLTIETDGSLGVLGTANIVDWTIAMVDGADSFTLTGPLSGGNSQLIVQGAGLTATATSLMFDFGAASGLALFQAPSIGAGKTFYCVQINGCFDGDGPGEAIDPRQNFSFVREARQGNVVLATAGGVPEPAAWGMMLVGFAAVGASMRSRRTTVTFA